VIVAAALIAILAIIYVSAGTKIVPQTENWLVERLGRYNRTLEAGLHIIVPVFERVAHKEHIQERQIAGGKKIPAITLDNVSIDLAIAILYRVTDASRAWYRIRNIDQAIETLITGVVRSVIGKTELDGVQSNRQSIAIALENELKDVSEEWGILISRVEVLHVEIDAQTQSAMMRQLEAERERRSVVTKAEGAKQSAILKADGELYAAEREAEARKLRADADAYSVTVVANAIANGGIDAITYEVKKIQAQAISDLGKSSSSKFVLLPSQILDGLSAIQEKFTSS
jgi:regulator of protease activity HflC (stomatin/prohibitin superfamily)